MYTPRLVLTAFALALTASALPTNNTTNSIIEPRGRDAFEIHVWNNCAWTKEFGMYSVTSDFHMVQHGKTANVAPGHEHVFYPSFYDTGMRLTGHAEWGLAGQWNVQALFEFGYSEYDGVQGTAYDLSLMEGSDENIGMGVYPHNDACESKTCWPDNCPPSQGWTNPDQTDLGNPADTVCYQGKTNFKVVFCP